MYFIYGRDSSLLRIKSSVQNWYIRKINKNINKINHMKFETVVWNLKSQ